MHWGKKKAFKYCWPIILCSNKLDQDEFHYSGSKKKNIHYILKAHEGLLIKVLPMFPCGSWIVHTSFNKTGLGTMEILLLTSFEYTHDYIYTHPNSVKTFLVQINKCDAHTGWDADHTCDAHAGHVRCRSLKCDVHRLLNVMYTG